MITIPGTRVGIRKLDRHSHICSLLELEGPLLSLYSDGRNNWLYLWCDTDGPDRTRWLLFVASRPLLVAYLERRISLLDVVAEAPQLLVLDEMHGITAEGEARTSRTLRRPSSLSMLAGYLPTDKSFFDPELAPEIELARELLPEKFAVPIDSDQWFAVDFNNFFKSYQRIYSFLYASRPRFVTTVKSRMEELLRAPWTGGFSRVNFFSALPEVVPAIHALRVPKMQYASPGDIEFEALASVGGAVRASVLRYIQFEAEIERSLQSVKATLTTMKLNKRDLSTSNDLELELPEGRLNHLKEKCFAIGASLGLEEEFSSLAECSPNTIVHSKAVAGLITQLQYLAAFQSEGMLDLERVSAAASLAP
jgi:hypothetical protein